jgi:hypothetical protein
MGFNVQLEDEHGEVAERLDDPRGVLYHVLPEQAGSQFQYLPYIDRYGDTIFNRPQMEPFVREWDRLISNCRDLEVRRLLTEVKRLATACQDGVHLYLRFVGE